MDTTLARPLTDFPQFWEVAAGICLLLALYLAYIGYRRYKGKGIIYLNELIFLWIYKLIKGKEKSKEIERQIITDTKKNKIYGSSAIIGAIGSVLLSILFIIGAILMTNTR